MTAVVMSNIIAQRRVLIPAVHEQGNQMSSRQLSRFWHFHHSAFQVCDVMAPIRSVYPSAIVALQYAPKTSAFGLCSKPLVRFSERAHKFPV